MMLESVRLSLLEQAIEDGIAASDLPASWREPRNWWRVRCRPSQQLGDPNSFRYRIMMAGRGAGKTISSAEMMCDLIELHGVTSLAAVAPTWFDVKKTLRPTLVAAIERRFASVGIPIVFNERFLRIGEANIDLLSAEKPERIRGGNYQAVWCDELAHFSNVDEAESRDNAFLNVEESTRIDPAVIIISTTPTPSELLRSLRDHPNTYLTAVSSYENASYLSERFFERAAEYKGSRRFRQEILGELLEDVEGAMWSHDDIQYVDEAPQTLDDVVVAIDPAESSSAKSDYAGLCVVASRGDDVYILHSEHVRAYAPRWARRALQLYEQYGANRIVAEKNGVGALAGPLFEEIAPHVPVEPVFASRSKWERAEIALAHFDRKRVYFIGSYDDHVDLIKEMVSFTKDSKRDDLVDAMVWGLRELRVVSLPDLSDWDWSA